MKVTKFSVAGLAVATVASLGAIAFTGSPVSAAGTYSETTGGVSNTWTNYANAGGYAGPQIGANQTVQIACKLPGFRVADGNTWWYLIASSPWNYGYYVSADPFYNNGQTSGSLHGTPFVDPAVPDCGSTSGRNETTGGVAHTWTNYSNAGGSEGPSIGANQTVQIACKLQGFRVADGNTWWYQIASAPWNNGFYVSADPFYNNGATSGSLIGTPWVDPAVPDCAGSGGGSTSSPSVTLAQGPAAPAGYRYAISLSGFAPSSGVSLTCYDSVSPNGFYTFSLTTNANGAASTQSYCYSGDGPDHWVIANGRTESNHVSWGSGSGGGTGGGGTGGGGGGTGGGGGGTGGGGGSGGGSGIANPFYNRSAAQAWALAHANDPQAYPAECTWFVSNALWAGDFQRTTEWTSAGSHGVWPKSNRPGSVDAWAVPNFKKYFLANYSSTWTDLGNLSTNAVPNAQVGDIIVYSWDGGKTLEHMSFVVGTAAGQYPEVSEWGTPEFTLWNYLYYQIHRPTEGYSERGWTWSQKNHKYLQVVYKGQARAYLIHINGGYFSTTF